MEVKLSRDEQEVAIKGHLIAQGMDLVNKTIKCVFGRESVTVDITDNVPNDDMDKHPTEEPNFGTEGLAPDVEPFAGESSDA